MGARYGDGQREWLKNNPRGLRKSHQGVVVVLRRDKPDALMLGIELADASPLIGLAGGVVQQRDPQVVQVKPD